MSTYEDDAMSDTGMTSAPPPSPPPPKSKKDRFLLVLSKILTKMNNLNPDSSFEEKVKRSYLIFSIGNEAIVCMIITAIVMILFFVLGVGNWLTIGAFIVAVPTLIFFAIIGVVFRKVSSNFILTGYAIFVVIVLELLQFSLFKYPVAGTSISIASIFCYSNLFAFNAKSKYFFYVLFNIVPFFHLIFFFFWILFSTEYSSGMTYTKFEMIFQLAIAHLCVGGLMFLVGVPTGFLSHMYHSTVKVVKEFSENIDHLNFDVPVIKKLLESDENVSFDVPRAFKRVILRLTDFKAFIPSSLLRPVGAPDDSDSETSTDSNDDSSNSSSELETNHFKFQVGSFSELSKTIVCIMFNTKVYGSAVVPAFTRIFEAVEKVVNEFRCGVIISINHKSAYLMFSTALTGFRFADIFRKRFKEIFNDFDLLTWQQKLEIFSRLGIGISHGTIIREVVGGENVKFEKYFGRVKRVAKALAQFSLENECNVCIDSETSSKSMIKDHCDCETADVMIMPETGEKILVESVGAVVNKFGDVYSEHRFIEMSRMKEMRKREIEVWDSFVSGDYDEMEKRIGDGKEKIFAKMLKFAENMKKNNMTINDIEKVTKKFKGGFVSLLKYLDLDVKSVKKDGEKEQKQDKKKEEIQTVEKDVIVSVK